jgi:phosphomannomutase/phosphoglucomutase
MVNKRLFGTFGVRRRANEVLTPEFASKLAAAYGTLVKGNIVGGIPNLYPMIKHRLNRDYFLLDVLYGSGSLPTPACSICPNYCEVSDNHGLTQPST